MSGYQEQPNHEDGFRGEPTAEQEGGAARIVNPMISNNLIVYGSLLHVLMNDSWLGVSMAVLGIAGNMDFLFS